MDLRTLLAVSLVLVLLMVPIRAGGNITQSPSKPSYTNPTSDAARTSPSVTPARSPDRLSDPQVLVLVVSWNRRCDGTVQLKHLWPSSMLSPQVCFTKQNETEVKALLGNVCHQRRECSGLPRWHQEEVTTTASQLRQEPSALTSETTCPSLRVSCLVREEDANVAGQLQAYKAATALLCCVLLVLGVIRFTRPTIQALQKRLSDRRQNRWVGPTQSHSVSYNRGKNTIKSSDPEDRLSYPALERLAITGSREPSSNRSSYNF
ncbi:CD5 molecule [Nelusetta ayraudi]|uniref:CD5 molecule n=1 Tax=Nelusetta ayraudi TaxID=303726 RepID=UPI003F714654